MTDRTVFEIIDVRKRYGKVNAVDGVTLEASRAEVLALLGPNGAGKTTTLEMLLGLRHPDSGSVRVLGGSPRDERVRARFGVTPQQTGVPETLRVREIVEFVAGHYAHPADVPQTLKAFGLEGFARRQAGGLSGGELRRLGLVLAFIGEPELVVLDEPTTGLDVEARRAVWEYVQEYARRGGTVLLTTHNMEEAQALATRIAVMHSGRVVTNGTPQQIRARASTRRIVYAGEWFDPAAFGLDALAQRDGERIMLSARDTDAVVRALVSNNIAFRDLVVSEGSLEDAVLSLGGENR